MNFLLKDRFSFLDIAVVLLVTYTCQRLGYGWVEWAALILNIPCFTGYLTGFYYVWRNDKDSDPGKPSRLNPPPPLCRNCRPPAPPGPRDITGKPIPPPTTETVKRG